MDTPHDQPAKQSAASSSDATPIFSVVKPGQGQYVRWGSVLGFGIIALAGALYLRGLVSSFEESVVTEWLRIILPLTIFAVLAGVIYWFVGRNRSSVDFMIATEGEMKKVNWSTKREIIGSTRVVIFTMLSLALILFMVDVFFMVIFSSIGILQVDVFETLFGRGE